jgi:hypothetical protein
MQCGMKLQWCTSFLKPCAHYAPVIVAPGVDILLGVCCSQALCRHRKAKDI